MLEHQAIHGLLETWTPKDSYRIRRAAVYQFHAAIADQWQQGRIFLAGDAAHQTPPFLGQGMNSGMRDVINLAWKLPLVLNGQCAPSLLDTYQAERDDHAHDLVSWAVDMGHLMQHFGRHRSLQSVMAKNYPRCSRPRKSPAMAKVENNPPFDPASS
jgi:3-(3-hydroxy-phenyl)propionate hydroxylase